MRNERFDESTGVGRRAVMRAVGGTTVGLVGLTGVAGATERTGTPRYNFYGCSQVCVDRKGVTAIVWTGKRFRSACITKRSRRADPAVRDWAKVYCYEVKDHEAVVGLCYGGTVVKNSNRCAENYPKPKRCRDVCSS